MFVGNDKSVDKNLVYRKRPFYWIRVENNFEEVRTRKEIISSRGVELIIESKITESVAFCFIETIKSAFCGAFCEVSKDMASSIIDSENHVQATIIIINWALGVNVTDIFK